MGVSDIMLCVWQALPAAAIPNFGPTDIILAWRRKSRP